MKTGGIRLPVTCIRGPMAFGENSWAIGRFLGANEAGITAWWTDKKRCERGMKVATGGHDSQGSSPGKIG